MCWMLPLPDEPRVVAQNGCHPDRSALVYLCDGGAGRRDGAEDLDRERQVVRSEIPDAVHVGARARPVRARAAQPHDRPDFS